MIERYRAPCISAIWSRDAMTARWWKWTLRWAGVEEFPCPECVLDVVRSVDGKGHDFVTFLTACEEELPGVRLHHGLTTSDIVDASESEAIAASLSLVSASSFELINALRNAPALRVVARTHFQEADPISLRDVWAIHERELLDALDAFPIGRPAQFSGPVGAKHDEANIFCNNWCLSYDSSGTQCVSRYKRTDVLYALTKIVGVCSRIARRVRMMSWDPNLEIDYQYVTSSSMPHKRNPTRLERIDGFYALLVGYLQASLSVANTWPERDIAHSSVDRLTMEDSFHLAKCACYDVCESLPTDIRLTTCGVEALERAKGRTSNRETAKTWSETRER